MTPALLGPLIDFQGARKRQKERQEDQGTSKWLAGSPPSFSTSSWSSWPSFFSLPWLPGNPSSYPYLDTCKSRLQPSRSSRADLPRCMSLRHSGCCSTGARGHPPDSERSLKEAYALRASNFPVLLAGSFVQDRSLIKRSKSVPTLILNNYFEI